MPSDIINDFTEKIKELPTDAKKKFISKFNSSFNQFGDEGKAYSDSWEEVNKEYKNEGDSCVAKSIEEMNDFGMYCDFQKMDEETRMVYGYATNDTLDSQFEIVEMDATAKAVEDYSKWRNIRVMHKAEPVGTAPVLEMRKAGLWVGAEIVDDDAWNKVKKGVYKGFSIGGRKLKVVQEFSEALKKNINRIKEYMLTEISLVDRPANPSATFSFIKRDLNEVNRMTEESKEVVQEATLTDAKADVQPVENQVVEEVAVAKAVEAVPIVEEKTVEVKEEAVETKVDAVEEKAAEPVIVKAESEVPVEEQVTMTKAEYESLKKQADLVKKQDELLDLLKDKLEKKFAAEEPKELVQKQDKVIVPKTIGEISVMKGGLFSKE
jgi:phage head maturation protease